MDFGSEGTSAVSDLYCSDNLVVRQIATGNRDRWVVTFDNYGIGHGFDRPGFGEAWLQAQGISAIHVMGRAEDWYQYTDISAALACVRAAVHGAARVMTYGSSMGGYAAIRFADAVGAHAALAFSPQYTLDPGTAGHDTRWAQDSRRISWLPDLNGAVRCAGHPLVIYDPVGQDRWHAERILADTPTTGIALPYTGHPVTSFLAEAGLLGRLALETLDGSLDAAAFRREARAVRRSSGVYLGELAERASARHPSIALTLARKAVDVSGGNDLARLSLARRLMTSGGRTEALKIFESLVEHSGRQDVYLIAYAQALAEVGRRGEARALADEVVTSAGRMAHLYAWAASICWLNGDVDDARNLIDRAIALDPGGRGYVGLRTDYWLGRLDAAGVVRPTRWLQLARWLARRSPKTDISGMLARLRQTSKPASGN